MYSQVPGSGVVGLAGLGVGLDLGVDLGLGVGLGFGVGLGLSSFFASHLHLGN